MMTNTPTPLHIKHKKGLSQVVLQYHETFARSTQSESWRQPAGVQIEQRQASFESIRAVFEKDASSLKTAHKVISPDVAPVSPPPLPMPSLPATVPGKDDLRTHGLQREKQPVLASATAVPTGATTKTTKTTAAADAKSFWKAKDKQASAASLSTPSTSVAPTPSTTMSAKTEKDGESPGMMHPPRPYISVPAVLPPVVSHAHTPRDDLLLQKVREQKVRLIKAMQHLDHAKERRVATASSAPRVPKPAWH